MNITEQLIKRYFEATATAEEEKMLRQILADPSTESTPAVEEARAVMGFTSLLRQRNPARNRILPVKLRTIAAAAAAVVIIGLYVTLINRTAEVPTGVAIYCQGEVSHSTEDALNIMHSQLAGIGQGMAESETASMLEALNIALEDE